VETFENGKSPGEDGFTVQFYNHFFDFVGADLLASLNGEFELGRLLVCQRKGITTLLPKDDVELLILQNWRPIFLLNVDYKIASKGESRSQCFQNLYIRTKQASKMEDILEKM